MRALIASLTDAGSSGRLGRRAREVAAPDGSVLLYIVACWPLLPWMYGRWFAVGSSPAPALMMLLALGSWAWMLRRSGRAPDGRQLAPAWLTAGNACLLAYALAYHFLPRLISAGIALLGMGCLLMGWLPARQRRRSWGLLGLTVLAAPLGPSLQYVCGYPLRVLAGNAAAAMLGGGIRPLGTGLTNGTHTVFVDGPCSGVRMLTTAMALSMACALLLRLSLRRTILIAGAGILLAVGGNALRAATLFLAETGGLPAWIHTAVGLVVFAACVLTLILLAVRLRKKQPEPRNQPPTETPTAAGRWMTASFCASLALAATAPLLSPGVRAGEETVTRIRWPQRWERHRLVPLHAGEIEHRFRAGFPGTMAQFRVGATGSRLLLRYTSVATRSLHPAEDCYRGAGWQIEPRPALVDASGRTWSRFEATAPDGTRTLVRQCYFAVDISGDSAPGDLAEWIKGSRSWPDASSWYWGAAYPRGSVRGTLAVTVCDDI